MPEVMEVVAMNTTKKAIFTAIIVIIFTLVYFALGSKQVYAQKAPIISTYYPIGVILGIIAIALLNRYYIKGGSSYIIISSLALIMLLFAFTFTMDFLYRPIL